MVDTVLGHAAADLMSFRIDFVGGISHGNTGSHGMEHFQIILSVTEGKYDGTAGSVVLVR